MGDPNFFGSMAIFSPGTRMNPSEDGDSYAFCETFYDEDGEQFYLNEKRIDCQDRQQMTDLLHAVLWALLTAEGAVSDGSISHNILGHDLNCMYTRNAPSRPTPLIEIDGILEAHREAVTKKRAPFKKDEAQLSDEEIRRRLPFLDLDEGSEYLFPRVAMQEADLDVAAGALHAAGLHRMAQACELASFDLRMRKAAKKTQ